MVKTILAGLSLSVALLGVGRHGSKGPFDPAAWPPTVDRTRVVHYISVDGTLQPPSASWTPNLKILTGGDHATEHVTAGGHEAVRVAMFKFNTQDDRWPVWANEHSVDVLMQIYGDDAILDKDGKPRY